MTCIASPIRQRGPGTMFQGLPRSTLGHRPSGPVLTPYNIIIAKWGRDRKVAFRLILPPKKPSGRFWERPEDFSGDRKVAIPANTSSKKTFRSLFRPPDSRNIARDFFQTSIWKIHHATRKPRFRSRRPRNRCACCHSDDALRNKRF